MDGRGQGNEGGHISWYAHMEPLLQAYFEENQCFSFEDPAQLIKFLQWMVGYVDDNSLILTSRNGQTTQRALAEAQKALTSRKKLLQSAGGDLALEKCVYSLMGWQQKKGKELLGSTEEMSGEIHITHGTHKIVTIKRIEAWEAERILGVR